MVKLIKKLAIIPIGSSRPETDSKGNDNHLDPDCTLIVNNISTTTTNDLDNSIAEKNSNDITGDTTSHPPTSVIELDNVKKSDDDEEEQNLSSALRNNVTDAGGGGGSGAGNENKKNLGQHHHDCKRTDSKRRKRTVSENNHLFWITDPTK